MDIPTSLIWNIILFDDAFKYGDSANLWGYVRRKRLTIYSIEVYNFVKCILVKY
jgi:hypothetical protein